MLNKKQLANEVPYQGGKSELVFYVEGLNFPDKDFDGLLMINLSLLEPIAEVSTSKNLSTCKFLCLSNYLYPVVYGKGIGSHLIRQALFLVF